MIRPKVLMEMNPALSEQSARSRVFSPFQIQGKGRDIFVFPYFLFSPFFFFHFNLQKAFNALCHSTHLYGRRLVLEWADTEETVEALRRRTADHFHGKASSWLLAHPAGTDLLAHSHAAPALPHPEEVGTLWPMSQSIFPIATGGPCTYPQPRPITC